MKKAKIKLVTRRGTRVGWGLCARCGGYWSHRWSYRESNMGEVALCGECKPVVLGQSFGKTKADPLNLARRVGGFGL